MKTADDLTKEPKRRVKLTDDEIGDKDLTLLSIILDRSGSMAAIEQATVDGFNELISKQKEVPGKCNVQLVQFDNVYEQVFYKPLEQVDPLKKIFPRGGTALNDAIGRTLSSMSEMLLGIKPEERPTKVIVVILTDGAENASNEFTQESVAKLVKEYTDIDNWEFIFLGANQDAVLTAKQYNIPAGKAMNYAPSGMAVNNTYSNVSRMVGNLRVSKLADERKSLAFSDEDRATSMASDLSEKDLLDTIVNKMTPENSKKIKSQTTGKK